jgi:hypothetical protein
MILVVELRITTIVQVTRTSEAKYILVLITLVRRSLSPSIKGFIVN